MVMTQKDHENFKNFTKCLICKKVYLKEEVKVKDHDHITVKHQGTTDQEHNLNINLSEKISVVFNNLQNYDYHLIFQQFGKYDFKINVVPKNKIHSAKLKDRH